ncbi:MAG: Cupin 2 conserved barrel domain protein [Bacteroidetes bacterium]|jgi:mannose-6-phosphate isomerase-like protein (cupin superfamily)|nr:Cupin 2 conserved barrel domain protein [Bacteroidota bacterium]
MKPVEKISENKRYTAVSVGKLSELMQHSLIHPVNKRIIEGKVFLKEPTGATGTEISFQSLPPHTELSYFHRHRKNEETYIFLHGTGLYQVDDDCFAVSEGSVVRVAPDGIRGINNTSDEPLIYIVVQSKENSLEEYSTADGERIAHNPQW